MAAGVALQRVGWRTDQEADATAVVYRIAGALRASGCEVDAAQDEGGPGDTGGDPRRC